ncbi:MAG: ribosome-binding factor A [Clostridiales bacterium GWF2_36_10]|nr:MAG: ribosome-binding factor A [Clostridiales bacterium GWF2_36_10]
MNHRDMRLAEEIKRVVSDLIHNELEETVDFFSIPHVKVTKDLCYAKIYISFFNSNSEINFKKVEKSKKFIRSRLASIIKLRKVPEITFILDNSIAEGADIIEKINKLNIPL